MSEEVENSPGRSIAEAASVPDGAEEMGADMAELQAMAAGLGAKEGGLSVPVQSQGEAKQEPEQVSATALMLAGMLVQGIRKVGGHFRPELLEAPEAVWEPIAEPLGGVLDHLGLERPELQNPWAKLGFSFVPLLMFLAVHHMMNQKKKPEDPVTVTGPVDVPGPVSASVPGAARVTFGTVAQ